MECVLERATPWRNRRLTSLRSTNWTRRSLPRRRTPIRKGRIHAEGLKPVSRLAGHNYAKLGEQFELVRPI